MILIFENKPCIVLEKYYFICHRGKGINLSVLFKVLIENEVILLCKYKKHKVISKLDPIMWIISCDRLVDKYNYENFYKLKKVKIK